MKIDDHSARRRAVPAAAGRGRKRKPLTCHDCGKRVFTSREGFWEHNENGGYWIWHLDCRAPWLVEEAK